MIVVSSRDPDCGDYRFGLSAAVFPLQSLQAGFRLNLEQIHPLLAAPAGLATSEPVHSGVNA
ncbi:MAG: hypothetical protein ACUVRV_07900 [Cyanobacteriota bacterium]